MIHMSESNYHFEQSWEVLRLKYKITIDIECSTSLRAVNLQNVKSLVEETVIENLPIPDGEVMFINTKLTNESMKQI
jgi:hypothetical protein